METGAAMEAVVPRAFIGVWEVQGTATLPCSNKHLNADKAGAVGIDQCGVAGDVHVVVAATLKHLFRTRVNGHLINGNSYFLLKL